MTAPRLLLIDNYDSFTYNLVQAFLVLGAEVDVRRNDAVTIEEALASTPSHVCISPGPGTPYDAGVSMEMIRAFAGKVPIFGVCLGHQAIAEAYGATVSRAPELLHGKTSQVFHHKQGVLVDLPSPFTATRYHSLAVERDTVPAELEVTSETEDGVIMSLRHKEFDIEGVQFHPESVLTEGGHKMLAEWLVRCGDLDARNLAQGLQPVIPN